MKTTITLVLCFLCVRLSADWVPPQEFRSLAVDAYEREHPAQPQPEFAGICIGVLVLVVGGIVVYKLVKYCKVHLPPPPVPPVTNSVPTNAPGTNINVTSYAAWIVPADSRYWIDPACGDCTCEFVINYRISGTNIVVGSCKFWRSDDGLDLEQFQSLCATNYGLHVNSMGQQFTSNDVPVASIPYTITVTNGVCSVTDSGPSNTVVVERKVQGGWLPVVTNVWAASFTNCYTVDAFAPASGAFYRAVLK